MSKNRVQITKSETATTDEGTEGASSLDASIETVDSLLDEMDGFRRFDSAGFDGYVAEQTKAAEKEEGDVRKARLVALREAMDAAKSAFASGGKARIKMYVDPDQHQTTKAESATPANLPVDENGIAFANVDVVKSVVGSLRFHVNKADGSVVPVTKAGESRAMLDRLALALGLEPYDGETKVDPYRIAWKVEEAVCALGKLAQMDEAFAMLGSMTGVIGAMPAASTPSGTTSEPPSGEVEVDDAAKAAGDASAVTKAAGDAAIVKPGAMRDADGWPLDFNA
jgi:hypothetical protein